MSATCAVSRYFQDLKHTKLECSVPSARTDLYCVECGCLMRLRQAEQGWLFYSCEMWPRCNGALPANDDGSPRGNPRSKELQGKRYAAHKVFDQVVDGIFGASRPSSNFERKTLRNHAATQTYEYLAASMGIPSERSHFGAFDEGQCDHAKEILQRITYIDVRDWWHQTRRA